MWRKRRTEITIETREVFTVRAAAEPALLNCAGCGRETRMSTPEEAAARALVSTRRIYRWVEAGDIHFVEMPGGSLLVCLDSLAAVVGYHS